MSLSLICMLVALGRTPSLSAVTFDGTKVYAFDAANQRVVEVQRARLVNAAKCPVKLDALWQLAVHHRDLWLFRRGRSGVLFKPYGKDWKTYPSLRVYSGAAIGARLYLMGAGPTGFDVESIDTSGRSRKWKSIVWPLFRDSAYLVSPSYDVFSIDSSGKEHVLGHLATDFHMRERHPLPISFLSGTNRIEAFLNCSGSLVRVSRGRCVVTSIAVEGPNHTMLIGDRIWAVGPEGANWRVVVRAGHTQRQIRIPGPRGKSYWLFAGRDGAAVISADVAGHIVTVASVVYDGSSLRVMDKQLSGTLALQSFALDGSSRLLLALGGDKLLSLDLDRGTVAEFPAGEVQ